MTTALLSSTHTVSSLDAQADRFASHLLDRTVPDGGWTHERLVLAAVALVRQHGPSEALDRIVSHRPDVHVTRTVFMVWAVDRLISAGLKTATVLWHPLVDRRSVLCWWDAATLDDDEARTRWVPPTLTTPDEWRSVVQPPATAGMMDTVSPSRTAVAKPSR